MNDDQATTPAVDSNAGQSAMPPAQPPVSAPVDATPNQSIAADALSNAPLTPAAPADTAVGAPTPPPAMPDPAAPAVADPAVPAAPIEEDSDKPADASGLL